MNQRALIHRLIAKCRQYENLAADVTLKAHELEQEIKQLQDKLASAEDAAGSFEEAAAWHAERAEQRSRELRQEREEAYRAEQDRGYRDYKESQALDQLKRAQSYGDEWGVSRAMRELEDIRRW